MSVRNLWKYIFTAKVHPSQTTKRQRLHKTFICSQTTECLPWFDLIPRRTKKAVPYVCRRGVAVQTSAHSLNRAPLRTHRLHAVKYCKLIYIVTIYLVGNSRLSWSNPWLVQRVAGLLLLVLGCRPTFTTLKACRINLRTDSFLKAWFFTRSRFYFHFYN